MGGSSIAAIVLILIAILISLASIFWLKRNERLCFKPYQEVYGPTVHINLQKTTQTACRDQGGQGGVTSSPAAATCGRQVAQWRTFSRLPPLASQLWKPNHCPEISADLHIALHPPRPHSLLYLYTANEGPVRVQHKCLVRIYVFPEMKLCSLVISKT